MFDEQADVFEDTQKRRAISNKMVLSASAPLPDLYVTQPVQGEDTTHPEHEQQTVAMPNDWQQLPITPIVPVNTSYKATIGASIGNRSAHKVAILAFALVVLFGSIGTALAFNASTQSNTPTNKGKTATIIVTNSTPGTATPGTPVSKAATPIGVRGTLSSLPQATATNSNVQQPATTNGDLTLQLAWYPQSANNNTTVPITILASQPNTQVQLIVTYEAPPGFYSTSLTDANHDGVAILQWHIRVFSRRHNGVIARMIAVARNDQGNIARSQIVTIMINTDR